MDALKKGELADVLNRFPALGKTLPILLRYKIRKLSEDTRANEQLSYEAVKRYIDHLYNLGHTVLLISTRRIARNEKRRDFLSRILEDRDPEVVSDRQIAAHASDLVIAGSDTTATALACIIYYLLQAPTTGAHLADEVRNAFNAYKDITYSSTAMLPYLKAVILEGLRMYPPLPLGLPRVVPDDGDTVGGYFLPGGVRVFYTKPLRVRVSES